MRHFHAVKHVITSDAGASSAGKQGDFSDADRTLFLLLKSSEFVLGCIQTVVGTRDEYIAMEAFFEALTVEIEKGWYELSLNIVSLRPGLGNLHVSSLGSLIVEFLAEKREYSGALRSTLHTVVGALPETLLKKIHHYLKGVPISMDNALGACILLRDYEERPNSLEKSVVGYVRSHDLDWSSWMYYLITVRHLLDLPLAASAFETLGKEIATALMEEYGHPSSWHGTRPYLQQMQSEAEFGLHLFKPHDGLLLVLHYLEDDGTMKLLPSAVDRKQEKFLLDHAVLAYIRTYFVCKESVKHGAYIRASLQKA